MTYLIFALALISLPTFACTRADAQNLVKASIAQGLLADEQMRTLKMGTVEVEEKLGERVWAVHAVVELEKFGRKVSEQAVVFRFNNDCQVIGSSGAVVKRVSL